jgi:phosphoglycolate phosphatase
MTSWKNLQAIVFDFDGTLATCPYDFGRMRESVLCVAQSYGIDHAALGTDAGLLESIECGAQLLAADSAQSQQFRKEALASLSALEYEAAAYTRLLPGTMTALERLRSVGYRLGIITRNSAAAVARIIGDTILPVETILSREDVQRPKPHPEHVERMLSLLESMPNRSLMVGDHPMDVETGKAAGMYTAAVLTGQTDELTLRAAQPDLLFPSIVELADMLLSPAGNESA